MLAERRFYLERYRGKATRHYCPACDNRERTFARYIDAETGQHVHPFVGRCNREAKCGYHYSPKQYFEDNGSLLHDHPKTCAKMRKRSQQDPVFTCLQDPEPPSFIEPAIFKTSLKNYSDNCFVQWLVGMFGEEEASKTIARYFIGTSKHWAGATVFWQVDTTGKVRTGQIIPYDKNTGKRDRSCHPTWVHSVLKLRGYNLEQCFFGEHLLKDNSLPVAIVEAPKTAVVADLLFRKLGLQAFVWIASCGMGSLNPQKCKVLKGRRVELWPDLGGYEKWQAKAGALQSITAGVKVHDLLNKAATEAQCAAGLDIADFLLDIWQEKYNTSQENSSFVTAKTKTGNGT